MKVMNGKETKLYGALRKIAEAANEALGTCSEEHNHERAGDVICCTPKSLPDRLHMKAAEVACKINPVNSPALTVFGQMDARILALEPQQISVLTSKYWGAKPRRLTVSFMETTPADLRVRIIRNMNAWTKTGSISFVETSEIGQVRISRGGGGYYSYLGTDIQLIPKNRQTMNLQGFTMDTPESEYRRVVRHETGHTLGFPHEHMRKSLVARIDRQKAYDYFLRTQGWDRATVDAQVLTSLDESSLMGTPADQTSIMCYQLPGQITIDGKPIIGGADINGTDYAFIGKIYPKVEGAALTKTEGETESSPALTSEEWDESEDVLDHELIWGD
jgi:hypothetical protein